MKLNTNLRREFAQKEQAMFCSYQIIVRLRLSVNKVKTSIFEKWAGVWS